MPNMMDSTRQQPLPTVAPAQGPLGADGMADLWEALTLALPPLICWLERLSAYAEQHTAAVGGSEPTVQPQPGGPPGPPPHTSADLRRAAPAHPAAGARPAIAPKMPLRPGP